MNHTIIKKQNIIEDYLCHRLAADLVDDFEEHLLFCEHCRKKLEQKETLIHSIQSAARQTGHSAGTAQERQDKENFSRDEHVHDVRWRYRIKSHRLLRIAAVLAIVLFGTSVIGVLLEMNNRTGPRCGITQSLSNFYGSLLGIGRQPYRRPIDRYVTKEFIEHTHLNDQPGYQPYELLEEFIHDQYRTSTPRVEVQSPVIAENLTTDPNGRARLRFEGFCKYPSIVKNNSIVLRIFTNQEQDYIDDHAIAETELLFTEQYFYFYRFEKILTLSLRRGLYYFTVEMERTDPLFVGKFYIDTLPASK
jgi:hypothetical protein